MSVFIPGIKKTQSLKLEIVALMAISDNYADIIRILTAYFGF
jgi:hypothetical protein